MMAWRLKRQDEFLRNRGDICEFSSEEQARRTAHYAANDYGLEGFVPVYGEWSEPGIKVWR